MLRLGVSSLTAPGATTPSSTNLLLSFTPSSFSFSFSPVYFPLFSFSSSPKNVIRSLRKGTTEVTGKDPVANAFLKQILGSQLHFTATH